MPPLSTIRLRLFGGMHLQIDDVTITAVHTERLQTLLAFLALHRDHPLRRDYVAFTLWPDLPETTARQRLRKALHDLHAALPCLDHALVTDGQSLTWHKAASLTVDVTAFEQAMAAASRFERDNRLALATEQLEAAIALYSGDLMPENYHEWFALRRRQFHNRFVDALQSISLLLERRRDEGAAIAYIKLLLQHEPDLLSAHSEDLHESTFCRLIRLSGRHLTRSDVEWAYRMYAYNRARYDLLASPEMTEMYEIALLRATETATIARKVPPRLTPFVGRGRELAELKTLLANRACRLLTVTGVAGVGKTSLAQCLAQALTSFAHGIYFVSARDAQDERQLLKRIAEVFELTPGRGMDTDALITQFVADKRLLLLIDNYEHLHATTAWLDELLTRAAGIKVMVTSRVRLNLAYEWVYELHGLGYGRQSKSDEQRKGRADESVDASAVTLFIQCARRVEPGFTPNDTERTEIVRICSLVEGLPLAVELAASWVRLFSCRQIAGRIAQDLNLLSDGVIPGDDFHHSMRAALEHSWNLLTAGERETFLGLCTFTGGFDAKAAIAVTGTDVAGLAILMDSSLIRKAGSERYELHNLIFQYGQAKLDAAPDLRQRLYAAHCTYYTDLISHHTQGLKDNRSDTVRRLRPDFANILQAWHWIVHQRKWPMLDRLYMGVGLLFYELALFRDGLDLFLTTIEQWTPTAHENEARVLIMAKLRIMGGMLAQLEGDLNVAESLLDAGEPIIDSLGLPIERALAYMARAMVAFHRGELATTECYCHTILNLVDDQDFVSVWAGAYIHLGDIARVRGDYAQAEGYYLPLLQHPKSRDAARGMGINLWRLGANAIAQGNLDEAGDIFLEGLAVAERNGDEWVAQVLLNQLGEVAALRHQLDASQSYYHRALQIVADGRGSTASALDSVVGMCTLLDNKGRSQRAYQYLAAVLVHPAAQRQTALHAGALRDELSTHIPADKAHALQLRGQVKPLNVVIAELLLM